MMQKSTIVLGLGSNLGNKDSNIATAIKMLHMYNVKCSQIYKNAALLQKNSPLEWNLLFYNVALKATTYMTPRKMLQAIIKIENNMGRTTRRKRWSPRIIDIDILLWNNDNVHYKDLIIPHPQMRKRAFVMHPMQQITPQTAQAIYNCKDTTIAPPLITDRPPNPK